MESIALHATPLSVVSVLVLVPLANQTSYALPLPLPAARGPAPLDLPRSHLTPHETLRVRRRALDGIETPVTSKLCCALVAHLQLVTERLLDVTPGGAVVFVVVLLDVPTPTRYLHGLDLAVAV